MRTSFINLSKEYFSFLALRFVGLKFFVQKQQFKQVKTVGYTSLKVINRFTGNGIKIAKRKPDFMLPFFPLVKFNAMHIAGNKGVQNRNHRFLIIRPVIWG